MRQRNIRRRIRASWGKQSQQIHTRTIVEGEQTKADGQNIGINILRRQVPQSQNPSVPVHLRPSLPTIEIMHHPEHKRLLRVFHKQQQAFPHLISNWFRPEARHFVAAETICQQGKRVRVAAGRGDQIVSDPHDGQQLQISELLPKYMCIADSR